MMKIKNSFEEKELEYYNLGEYCKNLCEKYTSLSEENREEFDEFSKKYTYFKPYFDFVMKYMDGVVYSPFFDDGKCLVMKNDKYFIQPLEMENNILGSFDMVSSDDKSIGLNSKIKCEDTEGCFVDLFGNILQLDYAGRHLKLAHAILNQNLISSVSCCRKFKDFKENGNRTHMIDFLINYYGLAYIKYKEPKQVIYNSATITEAQYKAFCKIKKFYNISEVTASTRRIR